MSWITPKTNWVKTDYINYTDYNRWKNNVEFIKDLLIADEQSATNSVSQGGVFYLHFEETVSEGQIVFYTIRFTGSESEEEIEYDYKFTESGTYDYGAFEYPEDGELYISRVVTRGCDLFSYEDMGADKLLNAYWRAAEMNRICDNLDSMCEALGVDFSGKPMYSDNGATPTYTELNLIEKRTRDLYNQIMGSYTMYLGIGYTGSRISNILL